MPTAKPFSKLLLVANVILIPLVLLIVLYATTQHISNPFVAKEYPFATEQWEKGYAVGVVVVTLADLDKRFTELYDDTNENRMVLANWKLAAESLSADAVLQAEGINEGIYGTGGKTQFDLKLAQQAEEHFNNQIETMDGERITIWFQKEAKVDYDVEAKKTRALTVIANFRNLIVENEMTFGEAADEIATMSEFIEVDPDFPENLYDTFSNEPFDSELYQDSTLTESLWTVDANEVTEPLLGRQYNTEAVYDSYYTIVKITKHDRLEFESAQDLVQARFAEGIKIELE